MPTTKKTTAKSATTNTTVSETTEMENSNVIDTNELLLKTLSDLQNTVNLLQNKIGEIENQNSQLVEENKILKEKANDLTTQSPNTTNRLLEYLTNKKSDREVTIVHNRELIGGLSTHIVLTGLIIDFKTLGEKRVLSWQQFEECVSKYRKWFQKEIILLDSDNLELAEAYNIPCVKRKDGIVLTRNDLAKLGKMSANELETFYSSLTEEDKAFLCSYWLGKCYEKDTDFYNRYKIELLNRLSDGNIFDNVLAVMNNDFKNKT